ncbi:hypothetical protein [Flagellimonas sp. CMM7]|nr:hypothetical protein [Flagellimonas sp. CMM7]UII80057.1 hypothetical protein LV704_00700 [Flagellimonas sp. CMM7]
MKKATEIKASNKVVQYFYRMMEEKREQNKEVNRKIKSGEITVAEQ